MDARHIWMRTGIMISAIACIILFDAFLLAILLAAAAILMLSLDYTQQRAVLFVLAAIAGTAAEALIVLSGAWYYTNPTLYLVPLYLPFLWGLIALYIDSLAQQLRTHDWRVSTKR